VQKTLKSKTLSALLWSFIDRFSQQGITFVVGIIITIGIQLAKTLHLTD